MCTVNSYKKIFFVIKIRMNWNPSEEWNLILRNYAKCILFVLVRESSVSTMHKIFIQIRNYETAGGYNLFQKINLWFL